MLPFHALLSLILIACATLGAGVVSRTTSKATLSLTTRINDIDTHNIVENDLARARAKKEASRLGKRSTEPVSINNAYVYYTAEVGIGSPPTDYTLLVDTGSAITWLGAGKKYVETSTSHDTGHSISVQYGMGNFSGEERTDTVTLASGLVITEQYIGVASSYAGFYYIDGILGLGPVDLTAGSVSGMDTVPTVMDNLWSQNQIPKVLGVYFTPVAQNFQNGSLTFGYTDSYWPNAVDYFPLTNTHPASAYWGIDQSIYYGDTEILSSTAGIVDTGTTLMLVASDAFEKYMNMTGATLDSATGLLTITPEQYDKVQPLTFYVDKGPGNTPSPFVVTRDAQTWPRSLNTRIRGGVDGMIYLVVGALDWKSGSGFDFVIGYTFQERYYTVYDNSTGQGRVGFAVTDFTFSELNGI